MGKMFFNDGSYFIGHFQNGLAEGEGYYLMANGDWYRGGIHQNEAETCANGVFYSPTLSY